MWASAPLPANERLAEITESRLKINSSGHSKNHGTIPQLFYFPRARLYPQSFDTHVNRDFPVKENTPCPNL